MTLQGTDLVGCPCMTLKIWYLPRQQQQKEKKIQACLSKKHQLTAD